MAERYLLTGGCVLTLGARQGNLASGDVLIEDSLITEVGPNLRARGAEVIDTSEAIVMPGFVDTHRHVWRALFKHLADTPHDRADLAAHLAPDDLYAATLVGLLGAVEAGTTTVVDWCELVGDRANREAVLQAHTDSGLRSVLVGPPGAFSDSRAGTTLTGFGTGLDLPTADLEANWRSSRERGLRIHLHLSPQDRRRMAGVAPLLGSDVTLVHPYGLERSDLEAVAGSGAGISLAPSSEMASGGGVPPLQELIDRDLRPGLGVGDELLAPGDMFAQMRTAISVQHAAMFDLKLAGKASLPNLLTTRQVIRYATIDGARAVGLDEVTGSIQPGKQADLVVLRADRPNIAPVNDPIGAVVWGMDTSNLDWVFVAGLPLMRQGRLAADLTRTRALAERARSRVLSALGPVAGVPGGMA